MHVYWQTCSWKLAIKLASIDEGEGDVAEIKSEQWVLPAQIPFADLKARDLEECVYWLLDAMGARDLEWRTGGAGGGAADGGRDLDATFYVPSPDGEMEPQRWWIECKGRKGTVEPDEVKSAVNNATAQSDLAYLVVVTNTTFSNPTRDWVKTWQSSHLRPKVKLWDHETLERLLSRHPTVVLRLFSEALSPEGLLKVAQQRFWDKLEYTPVRALQSFWAARDTIEIDPLERVALIANELAHGSIIDRPWAAHADLAQLLAALQIALVNMLYLRVRASKIGIDEEPISAAVAHIILVLLRRLHAGDVAEIVLKSVGQRDEKIFPDKVIEMMLMPILNRLAGEMQDVCSADCMRVLGTDATTLVGVDDPVEVYWRRFDPAGTPADAPAKSFLRLESLAAPCKVGFPVGQERGCPLYEIEPTTKNVTEFLTVVERVLEFRLAEAKAKAIEDAAKERPGAAGTGEAEEA